MDGVIKGRLESLRQEMEKEGVDYYLIPTSDFHNSEYVNDYFKAREYFSGFTGSNGSLVVGREMAGLWTDGRYFIQAEKELEGSGITLFRMQEEGVPEIPDFLKADQDSLLTEYERHNRELNKVKNYIRNKNKKNRFELLFMNVYESYREQANEVTERLKQQALHLQTGVAEQMRGLCHGDYNQHNVLLSQGEWVILNFEQMTYDIMVQDLANFVRKILEKYNWNTGLGIEMITEYTNVRKLLPEESEQLYLRLAYPKKFWKIANHYSSSRKSWISGRDIEKLEKIIAQEPQRKQFLKMLFYFTS